MEDKGIREFQQKREKIIISLINKSCIALLEKKIDISINSVTQEIISNFDKEKIDKKYLVSTQTIGRNKKYSSIWKEYKKKQKITFFTKKEKINKELEFSIRDKYDMLKQDYIELMDNYTYLQKKYKEDIKENKSHHQIEVRKDFTAFKNYGEDESIKVLTSLKNLLINGSVVIVEIDNTIIIKNLNQKDDNRITINKDEWNKI